MCSDSEDSRTVFLVGVSQYTPRLIDESLFSPSAFFVEDLPRCAAMQCFRQKRFDFLHCLHEMRIPRPLRTSCSLCGKRLEDYCTAPVNDNIDFYTSSQLS